MLKRLKKNLFSFWIWQFFGWISYWLLLTFAFLTVVPRTNGALYVAQFMLVRTTFGFILTSLMSFIYRRWVSFSSFLRTFLLVLCSSIFFGCIWVYLMIIYTSLTGPKLSYEAVIERLASDLLSFSSTLLGWSAFYIGIKYWQTLQTEREQALEAKNLAQEAELKMLRYQLNPHFLFNSLNSASALIRENPNRAEKMIDELSDFLRYSLTDTKGDMVILAEEIEAIKNYLSIEKIRFEEKIKVNFEISDEVKKLKLPNFLLHPLIENSVKYGMQTSELPLQIDIRARQENQALIIEISNTGKWLKDDDLHNNGTKVGLENVKKRLEQFLPGRHQFRISEQNNRVGVLIKINL